MILNNLPVKPEKIGMRSVADPAVFSRYRSAPVGTVKKTLSPNALGRVSFIMLAGGTTAGDSKSDPKESLCTRMPFA
jgi:hypothetical protein